LRKFAYLYIQINQYLFKSQACELKSNQILNLCQLQALAKKSNNNDITIPLRTPVSENLSYYLHTVNY